MAKQDLAQLVAEAAASSAAAKTTYWGGAVSAFGGWLLSSHGIAFMGLCVAAAGFATQLILGIRRDWRERREHEARMKGLE